MTRTKQTRHKVTGVFLLLAILGPVVVQADAYRDARAELIAAYQKENYPRMLLAARRALAARPGFPGALFNLALTQTLNSDHRGSLQTLNTLLDKGVDFGAAELKDFAVVRELNDWPKYLHRLEALSQPAGDASVIATYPESNFVPEGIAIDGDGRLFLGSIHTGQLVALGETPKTLIEPGVGWSVFGMRFHSDGSLWFASAAVPQLQGVGDDEGKTGLFRVHAATGEITRTAVLPQYAKAQVLGDLIIADENTLYATDSLTGAIYRYFIDSNEFETLVERGRLGSPQGLVLDESGRFLYVADYNGGLYRVSLQDGSMLRLEVDEAITDYGIDGLYRHGDELIAIQNGIRPHRVVALSLIDDGSAIARSRVLASNLNAFDEPTLGAIRDDNFYFVANSHWNRFDRENKLPDGLSGPIVLRVPLN